MRARKKSTPTLIGLLSIAVVSGVSAQQAPVMEMTTTTPHQITTPDRVETPIGTLEFFDGVPIGDTKERVFDYMDRARAAQVYVNMIPAVSMYTLRQAQHEMGATESHQILIWEELMDSKTR